MRQPHDCSELISFQPVTVGEIGLLFFSFLFLNIYFFASQMYIHTITVRSYRINRCSTEYTLGTRRFVRTHVRKIFVFGRRRLKRASRANEQIAATICNQLIVARPAANTPTVYAGAECANGSSNASLFGIGCRECDSIWPNHVLVVRANIPKWVYAQRRILAAYALSFFPIVGADIARLSLIADR